MGSGVRLLLLNLLLIAGLPVVAYVGFFGMWCDPRAKTELWRCGHYPIGFLVYLGGRSRLRADERLFAGEG